MCEIIDFGYYKQHRCVRRIKSTSHKKGNYRNTKPKQQGELDGLCGVYAIVNALALVCGLAQKAVQKLFNHLIMVLDKKHYVAKAIVEGTSRKQLCAMLDAAISCLHKKWQFAVSAKPLFRHNAGIDIKTYWRKLQGFLESSNHRAIIIGVHGRHDHWTCVCKVTDEWLCLMDSDGMKRICKRGSRIGKPYSDKRYHLLPTQVWGIRLHD